jgi:drug/metabolite transporter (DMT)-like permease
MYHDLFIAIVAGLGGMIGWGFSEFATKKSVDVVGTISSLVWAHIFGSMILFVLLLSRPFLAHNSAMLPATSEDWLALVFSGALQAVVYYFAYKAFEEGEVSILSPIFASFAGIVALLSLLLFGEALNIRLVPALVLIFMGTILINLDLKSLRAGQIRIKAVPGLKDIIIATILAAIWTLGWNEITKNKDWLVYTSFMFLFMTLSAYALAKLTSTNILKIKAGVWKFLWLIAIGEVVAYLAITYGYARTTHTSIVALLSGASSAVTIMLARVFLKEKMTRLQTVGSITVITGIVFLAATT